MSLAIDYNVANFDESTWMGHAKTYEACHSCSKWKVLIWLHMCGACAMIHKAMTDKAAAEWKAEWDAMQKTKAEGPTHG